MCERHTQTIMTGNFYSNSEGGSVILYMPLSRRILFQEKSLFVLLSCILKLLMNDDEAMLETILPQTY